MTPDEWKRSKSLDKQAKLDRIDNKGREIAAQKAAYYEANKEKWNAYMRDYRRRKKQLANRNKKAASGWIRTGNGAQECSHAPNISKS